MKKTKIIIGLHLLFWFFETARVYFDMDIQPFLPELIGNMVAFYTGYFFVAPKVIKANNKYSFLLFGLLLALGLLIAYMFMSYLGYMQFHMCIKCVGMVVYCAFYLGGCCLALRLGYDWLLNLDQNKDLVVQKTNVQVQFMKSNVNLPFIVETLEHLESIALVDPARVKEPVLQLSNLLRYGTYDAMQEQVSVDREIETIEEYIGLVNQTESAYSLALLVEGNTHQVSTVPNLMVKLVGYWRQQLAQVLYEQQQIIVQVASSTTSLLLPHYHRFDLAHLLLHYPEIDSKRFRTHYGMQDQYFVLTIYHLPL